MKRSLLHLVAIFVTAAFVSAALLDAMTSRVQSQSAGKTSNGSATKTRVRTTSRVRTKPSESTIESTTFGPAATRNGLLRNELNWTFGGKEQSGWHLYTPLISSLIGTNQEAGSASFAAALARWQDSSGVVPSGVLDDESLNKMISLWQGARIKDRSFPDAAALVTVPASDFYDQTRPDDLRQVERETYAAYKRLVAAAAKDPSLNLATDAKGRLTAAEKYLKIISAFRTREYQEQLRRKSPDAGRAGLAVNSPHFTGRALDLYVGGEPVETKDSNRALQVRTPVYLWLVRNAERFGFRPYFYEPWHWEYVN